MRVTTTRARLCNKYPHPSLGKACWLKARVEAFPSIVQSKRVRATTLSWRDANNMSCGLMMTDLSAWLYDILSVLQTAITLSWDVCMRNSSSRTPIPFRIPSAVETLRKCAKAGDLACSCGETYIHQTLCNFMMYWTQLVCRLGLHAHTRPHCKQKYWILLFVRDLSSKTITCQAWTWH